MTFDWKLYVKLADELINHHRTAALQEAYFRSAMSRSYYGVFCIASSFLSTKGVSVPKTRAHTFVQEKYKLSSNETEKKIGDNLERLWRRRLNADYDKNAEISFNIAKEAHILAVQTIGELINVEAI